MLIENSVLTNANITSNKTSLLLSNYNDYLTNNHYKDVPRQTIYNWKKKSPHYIMTKCFVTFTGAITKNKRKKLLNRHVFMNTYDKSWRAFINEIYKFITLKKKKIFTY